MAIAHRADPAMRDFSPAPAVALQLAVSFQARGFRMTSFGGKNLLHLEMTFCVQKEKA
jgi:hypothetical protein